MENIMSQVETLMNKVFEARDLQIKQNIEELCIVSHKKYNVKELKQFCKEREIKQYSKLKKHELIEKLYVWEREIPPLGLDIPREFMGRDEICYSTEANTTYKRFTLDYETYNTYFKCHYQSSVFLDPKMTFEIEIFDLKKETEMFKNYNTENLHEYPYMVFKIHPPRCIWNSSFKRVIFTTFRYNSPMANIWNSIINPKQYEICINHKYYKENQEQVYIDGGNVIDLNDNCPDTKFNYF